MRCAIIDNGTIVEERDFDRVPTLEGKPYRRILPIEVTDPPYDPATQTRSGPVDTIGEDSVARVFTISDKPLAEIKALLSAEVKAEAYRRIVAIVPEWKQRNLIAQATQLLLKGQANWSQDDSDAWDAGDAIWQQVAAIRAASDAIEAAIAVTSDGDEARQARAAGAWPE